PYFIRGMPPTLFRPIVRTFIYSGEKRLGAAKAYPTMVGPALIVIDGRFNKADPFDLFTLNHELAHLYDIGFRQQILSLYAQWPLVVNIVGSVLLLTSTTEGFLAFLMIAYLLCISRPGFLRADREVFADMIGIWRLGDREAQARVLKSLMRRYADYC